MQGSRRWSIDSIGSEVELQDNYHDAPHPQVLPSFLQRLKSFSTWIDGRPPRNPHHQLGLTVTGLPGSAQTDKLLIQPIVSVAFLDRISDVTKFWVLSIFSLIYVLSVLLCLIQNAYSCDIGGYGKPIRLSCTSRPWRDSADCGLDGLQCRPFHNVTFAFRCPANCGSVQVLEPYTIGDQIIQYQSLIVGGHPANAAPNVHFYRGDSFICGAAIHAGLIKDHFGGAGIVRLIGERSDFPSTVSNGIESIAFAPQFPLSFTFEESARGMCSDPRWIILGLTIAYTLVLVLCTPSPSSFFGATFVSAYFCIALAADAPEPSSYYQVVSLAFRGFLPAAFTGYVVYKYCVKRTLQNLKAPFDMIIFWVTPFWVGALDNLTFDKLPLQRLTPHDLRQPGAIVVLIVILSFILAAAIGQILGFRREGRLRRYLLLYACIGGLLLFLLLIPNMNLRLHHYIIALILLPGTAIQTRPSLIYQGLLVGLFINGIARWGFDSILQTPGELFAIDPNDLVPHINTPQITGNQMTFSWDKLSSGYDSVSVLVNDVERYRGYEDHEADSFSWTKDGVDEPTYLRFGYVKYGKVGKGSVGRYSRTGTWLANGTWLGVDVEEEKRPS